LGLERLPRLRVASGVAGPPLGPDPHALRIRGDAGVNETDAEGPEARGAREETVELLPGLVGEKMSSSNKESKIDLLDSEDEVSKKINKAECAAGDANNGLLPFTKYIIFTIKNDKKQIFTIERDKKFGGDLTYKKYSELESDFINKKLHPLDLKRTLSKEINALLAPFRKNFSALQKLHKAAYPN